MTLMEKMVTEQHKTTIAATVLVLSLIINVVTSQSCSSGQRSVRYSRRQVAQDYNAGLSFETIGLWGQTMTVGACCWAVSRVLLGRLIQFCRK